MNTRHDAELPMYFGPGKELFGLFHAPATGSTAVGSRIGVLLCPPLGQDQIRCHRIYRQLAHALVAEGIPTLRYDYYGTGDSAGSSADIDFERCLADAVTAASELRLRAGIDRVFAFGARLGGSIALAAAARAHFAEVVAWDPVIDGDEYVARLDAMQSDLGVDAQRFTRPRLAADTAGQWLGFSVSKRLRQQIAELRIEPSPAPVLVLDSLAPASRLKWQDVVAHAPVFKVLEPPTPWDDVRRIETAILSHPLIQAVTERMRASSAGARL